MIIPAFALSTTGGNVTNESATPSSNEYTAENLFDEVTRASVLGRVRVRVSDTLRQNWKSDDAKRLIRASQGGLIVGPFNVPSTDQKGLDDVEEACVGWLNSGAFAVVLTGAPEACVVIAERLPRERTYYGCNCDNVEDACQTMRSISAKHCVSGFEITGSWNVNDCSKFRESAADPVADSNYGYGLGHKHELFLVDCGSISSEIVGKLGKDYGVHVVCYGAEGLKNKDTDTNTSSTSKEQALLDAGEALVSCLRTDRPDGLFTTVVCDECGIALGLVYSSAESICESLRTGTGVYYSRSRGGLWRKGATSGAVQELVSVRFDCDGDALRFCVRQKGSPPSFCHTGMRSCWGPAMGLGHLQRTLQSRLLHAPAGSYTKRLFNDSALLRNKLLEEAQELSEAHEPDHVAAEAADVMYFAMVAAIKGGANLEAIEAHLNARTLKIKRRPGNAKPERIAAAAAELDAIRAAKRRKVE